VLRGQEEEDDRDELAVLGREVEALARDADRPAEVARVLGLGVRDRHAVPERRRRDRLALEEREDDVLAVLGLDLARALERLEQLDDRRIAVIRRELGDDGGLRDDVAELQRGPASVSVAVDDLVDVLQVRDVEQLRALVLEELRDARE